MLKVTQAMTKEGAGAAPGRPGGGGGGLRGGGEAGPCAEMMGSNSLA